MIRNYPKLSEIRNHVVSSGGTYKKLPFQLNGNDAYEVNGLAMSKPNMINRYRNGDI